MHAASRALAHPRSSACPTQHSVHRHVAGQQHPGERLPPARAQCSGATTRRRRAPRARLTCGSVGIEQRPAGRGGRSRKQSEARGLAGHEHPQRAQLRAPAAAGRPCGPGHGHHPAGGAPRLQACTPRRTWHPRNRGPAAGWPLRAVRGAGRAPWLVRAEARGQTALGLARRWKAEWNAASASAAAFCRARAWYGPQQPSLGGGATPPPLPGPRVQLPPAALSPGSNGCHRLGAFHASAQCVEHGDTGRQAPPEGNLFAGWRRRHRRTTGICLHGRG